MNLKFVWAAVLFFVAGCDATPVVSGFNGDSVTIKDESLASEAEQIQAATVEATRICGRVGKQAEYASTSVDLDNLVSTHLFLCL